MSEHLHIIYEDNWLALAEKPAGLASEATNGEDSMLLRFSNYLQQKYPAQKQLSAGLPHRLDKPVSGLLLLTKRRQVLKELGDYPRPYWKKYYLAVISGSYNGPVRLEHYLGKTPGSLRASVHTQATAGARKATLNCHVLERNTEQSTVFIELLTGRYHQIRAQFAAQGHPVLGDTLYMEGIPNVPPSCIALHACKLIFRHPVQPFGYKTFRSIHSPAKAFAIHPALSESMQILSNSMYF